MGKCVRIRGGRSKPPPPPAASCLTLRSGRRVLPVVAASACSAGTTTSGRPRRRCHRGSATTSWCCGGGAAISKKSASGSPRRSGASATHVAAGSPKEEVLPSPAAGVDVGVCGDSFEKPKTTLMTDDDCDAAAMKAKAKHENESHRCSGQTAWPPPTEAEIEAFFAAAELAERRRFAEAYNYDVALDRPLEGRFEWAPMST